jgi:hypothetical protein
MPSFSCFKFCLPPVLRKQDHPYERRGRLIYNSKTPSAEMTDYGAPSSFSVASQLPKKEPLLIAQSRSPSVSRPQPSSSQAPTIPQFEFQDPAISQIQPPSPGHPQILAEPRPTAGRSKLLNTTDSLNHKENIMAGRAPSAEDQTEPFPLLRSSSQLQEANGGTYGLPSHGNDGASDMVAQNAPSQPLPIPSMTWAERVENLEYRPPRNNGKHRNVPLSWMQSQGPRAPVRVYLQPSESDCSSLSSESSQFSSSDPAEQIETEVTVLQPQPQQQPLDQIELGGTILQPQPQRQPPIIFPNPDAATIEYFVANIHESMRLGPTTASAQTDVNFVAPILETPNPNPPIRRSPARYSPTDRTGLSMLDVWPVRIESAAEREQNRREIYDSIHRFNRVLSERSKDGRHQSNARYIQTKRDTNRVNSEPLIQANGMPLNLQAGDEMALVAAISGRSWSHRPPTFFQPGWKGWKRRARVRFTTEAKDFDGASYPGRMHRRRSGKWGSI